MLEALAAGGAVMAKGPKPKDFTGQRFWALTAIRPVLNQRDRGTIPWVWRCDCGNEVTIGGPFVRKGDRKHCGCKTTLRTAPEKTPPTLIEKYLATLIRRKGA